MKQVLFFMAFASLSISAFARLPSRQECSQRLANDRHLIEVAKERFNVGEVTRADVDQTELDLLDTELECASITRDQYCLPANLQKVENLVQSVKEEISVGQRDAKDLREVQQRQLMMQEICN